MHKQSQAPQHVASKARRSLFGLLLVGGFMLGACAPLTGSIVVTVTPRLAANGGVIPGPTDAGIVEVGAPGPIPGPTDAGVTISAMTDCTPGREVDQPAYFTEVIQALQNPSVPVSDFAVQAFLQWEPYENTSACWNPLATTSKIPGGTDFNSAGVQNYPDRATGIRATANTLNLSSYPAIRTMLAKQGFDEVALTQALLSWIGSRAYADAVVALWKESYNK